jgi:hypothetical protein
MKNDPKYILDEVNLSEAGLKVVVFDQYGNYAKLQIRMGSMPKEDRSSFENKQK